MLIKVVKIHPNDIKLSDGTTTGLVGLNLGHLDKSEIPTMVHLNDQI